MSAARLGAFIANMRAIVGGEAAECDLRSVLIRSSLDISWALNL
jgi:hypothetical protein